MGTQKKLVSQVRALMIEANSRRGIPLSHRQRYTDEVVRVDQIVRRGAEIELREYASGEAELDAVARRASVEPEEPEYVADADRAHVGCELLGIATQIRDERIDGFWVGDQGA